ncbi:MAG: prolyl oligopeptidase family serine peptidase [Terriglobales bacterium]|jgi:dipeptidyl aminopeptidase/acylaminoacyl peptidase
MRRSILLVSLLSIISVFVFAQAQTAKPKLTFDEFFNSVSFDALKVSPDGNSVVIGTERADWDQQIFRKDLWLYRIATGSLTQLTQSGHDSSPQWSPDGQWIAFLSGRKVADAKDADAGDGKERDGKDKDKDKDKDVAQLLLISPSGGEAFAITSGEDEVHSFAWSGDSKAIVFATRQPWTKQQNDDHKKDWKDVIRYRGDERGDTIFRITLDEALARHAALGSKEVPDAEKDSGTTPGAVAIARTPLHVEQMSIAHDGSRLAFVTSSVSERQEKVEDIELYLINLTSNAAESTPIRLTHNEAVELNLEWAPDNRHLFFQVNMGSLERKYEDPQPRLYWIDAGDTSGSASSKREVQRWFADYPGEVVRYTPLPDGSVLCACRTGTEVQLVSQANPKAAIVKREGWAGTYETPTAAAQSQSRSTRIAFTYSATERPTEVYIADGPDKLAQARPITSFNKLFSERDLPRAKPYRWTSTDGTPVEGILMYPPGKFEAKNLPMFVLIHGGPQDADGNHFEADWYQWDRLAATAGWLVFEPNYRGSTGYGDEFALQIIPEIVSRPGKDILTGVDALVKDGIADPSQLAVGGYSYGGYMTNWLITQTTRFKAAVTGAGAVEHVANWGNDDTTFDDAYFLGGLPWETPDRYRSEGAIYQLNKVRTPTHMVAGADDVRVAVLEDYLLDRALHELNVPSELLIFPGEGHELAKNPWHGKIKVREELKWLAKYGGVTGAN